MRRIDEILEAHREELERIYAEWQERTAGPSAIEAARDYGVDMRNLLHQRRLSPVERLRAMQSLARFVIRAREAVWKQKEQEKLGRHTRL